MEDRHQPIRVFISSKQAEFVQERAALLGVIRELPLLSPVVAEEWPAERANPRVRYTADAKKCPIYVGVFGQLYSEPTEREYHAAQEHPLREILIYIKRDTTPEPALGSLLGEMSSRHVVARFTSVNELMSLVERDLWAAVSRMITHYMEVGQGPPVTRSGGASPQRRRWERQRARLGDLGLPGLDIPAEALNWAERLTTMRDTRQSASATRAVRGS